ncbi:MAG: tRNA lysidine(34) synthetase TilS [Bacteroidales bacterium]|nr:tRNA lysidine(34) synthetase TilS [Bacteroidales bacterium]
MKEKFLAFINQHQLFAKTDKILLTVSGGIDSVCMAHLFHSAGFNFGIAHCNFNLRGAESDGDEAFVKELAKTYNVDFFIENFNTESYAAENKISVQMAARNLRYNWFEKVRALEQYDYIAVAHNKNDLIESFFINLARGTGIKGLTGFKAKNGYIIRPLLLFTRQEIMEYSEINNIKYREDSSNSSTKYIRNKIRHNILPLLEEINPRITDSMVETIERIADAETIYSDAVKAFKNKCTTQKGDVLYIDINLINQYKELKKTYLYEIIREYGFSNKIIKDVLNSLTGISGKNFYSKTHRIVKDRKTLIITPYLQAEDNKYYVDRDNTEIDYPVKLKIEIIDCHLGIDIVKDQNFAFFDIDKLSFPLILRKWKSGDYFQPFGMKGLKKLSDYFIDMKLSIPEKENIWILASGEKIIWIIGHRTDEHFKITSTTKTALKIQYIH